jgi:tetratricopeptide (TPR) repeat protein
LARALSLGEKSLELAKKLDAHEVIAGSYMWLGEISLWLGHRKKALECFERALKITLDNGYVETAVWAYDDLGLWAFPGENEKRLEHLEKGLELAKKVGTIDWVSLIDAQLAHSYVGMGNMNKGIALAEESVLLNRKAGNKVVLCWSLDGLGLCHQILGEWDIAEQYYMEALGISQKLDDFQSIFAASACLGLLHLEKGEWSEARNCFERAYDVVEKHGVARAGWSQHAIRACIELGETEKATNLIDSLQKSALGVEDKDLYATVDAMRAMLLRAQKRFKESIDQFEKALQEFEALDTRRWNIYWFAKFVYEYARAYLERDQEDDREKAHNLLNQALELFQKLGAKKDIERIIAKKKLLTA